MNRKKKKFGSLDLWGLLKTRSLFFASNKTIFETEADIRSFFLDFDDVVGELEALVWVPLVAGFQLHA